MASRLRPLRIVTWERDTVTTMVWGMERFGFARQTAVARQPAARRHPGGALVGPGGAVERRGAGGGVAGTPGADHDTLEREGARGVPKVGAAGPATVLSELREGVTGRSAR